MPRFQQLLLRFQQLLCATFDHVAKAIELRVGPEVPVAITRVKVSVGRPRWEVQQRLGRSKVVPVTQIVVVELFVSKHF